MSTIGNLLSSSYSKCDCDGPQHVVVAVKTEYSKVIEQDITQVVARCKRCGTISEIKLHGGFTKEQLDV